MEQDINTGKGLRNLVRQLCFALLGVSAFTNPLDVFSPYHIAFGAVTGLLFGWLFRKFLGGFLSVFNLKFKKEKGKETIRYAVDRGMLFLV
ncbi:MAG TPA: hypothetical protein VN462_04660, partial [Negativicutes bacterium]|nr:hypothetical protein [Negativicutes bacterium]